MRHTRETLPILKRVVKEQADLSHALAVKMPLSHFPLSYGELFVIMWAFDKEEHKIEELTQQDVKLTLV